MNHPYWLRLWEFCKVSLDYYHEMPNVIIREWFKINVRFLVAWKKGYFEVKIVNSYLYPSVPRLPCGKQYPITLGGPTPVLFSHSKLVNIIFMRCLDYFYVRIKRPRNVQLFSGAIEDGERGLTEREEGGKVQEVLSSRKIVGELLVTSKVLPNGGGRAIPRPSR